MLSVGELARQAGVKVQTVHYYERQGILPKAARTPAGYRKFPEEAVRIIGFVKQAQGLGFSLDEIQQLLRLRSARRTSCERVRRVSEEKLALISEKIEHLEHMKSALETLVRACRRSGPHPLECPILESLEEKT